MLEMALSAGLDRGTTLLPDAPISPLMIMYTQTSMNYPAVYRGTEMTGEHAEW